MTTNAEFHERILQHKADIALPTLKSYTSMLRGIYYRAHGTDKTQPIDFDWYLNGEEVLKALEDKDAKIRKTYLSALMALVGKDVGVYSKQMKSDVKEYNKWVEKQEMTEKQKENWKSFEDVKKIVTKYEKQAKVVLKNWEANKRNRDLVEDWLILALTTGVYFPPRRSLDWVKMKFRNYDTETDNYVDLANSKFVFNQYKTVKVYGKQEMKIKSRVFKNMLQMYIKTLPDTVDRIVNDFHWNESSSVRIAQRLNKIFGLNISTSMLRHIYLSFELQSVPPLEKLNQLSNEMGHSVSQQLEYIKR